MDRLPCTQSSPTQACFLVIQFARLIVHFSYGKNFICDGDCSNQKHHMKLKFEIKLHSILDWITWMQSLRQSLAYNHFLGKPLRRKRGKQDWTEFGQVELQYSLQVRPQPVPHRVLCPRKTIQRCL